MTESKKPGDPDLERIRRREAEFEAPERPERVAERKRVSARCGHVKRRLLRHETLEGDLLNFAIGVVGEGSDIAVKLKAGERLSDYELHLMVDVHLLHVRLGARPAPP